MTGLLEDSRHALRVLRRRPGFAALAVITLGLGIGANTVIFTGVYALLLQPLAYPEADRLVVLWQTTALGQETGVSFPDLLDRRAASRSFSQLAASRNATRNLALRGGSARVTAALVSRETLPMLDGRAFIGRTFAPDEQRPGGAKVVLLGHALWQSRLGSDPGVVGRSVRLDDDEFTVIGILPPAFLYPLRAELWLPLEASEPGEQLLDAGATAYEVLARLAPGVSLEQASREAAVLQGRSAVRRVGTAPGSRLRVARLRDTFPATIKYGDWMLVLQCAVLFVLLIASVNLANLLLAHHAERRRELTIRLALGGSRGRLTRLLLAETLLLGFLGTALGLLLARWGLQALLAALPWRAPGTPPVVLDLPVLLVTIAVSLATTLAFGLAPARIASRGALGDGLRSGTGTMAFDPRRRRLSRGLIVAEVSLSVVLLAAAGLMIRTLLNLARESPGFDTERTIAVSLSPSPARCPSRESRVLFDSEAIRRLRAVPGVESVGGISFLPLVGYNPGTSFSVEGRQAESPDALPRADMQEVTADYFAAMQIAIVRGRAFEAAEMGNAGVVIVNQALASRFWPDGSALGRRIRLAGRGGPSQALTVVGVAADVKQFGLNTRSRPELYLPQSTRAMRLVIRTAGSPAGVLPSLRDEIRALAGDDTAFDLKPMSQVLRESTEKRRVFAWLLAALGAIALAMTALGIYGVVSNHASQRTREIGLRLAVGGRPADVVRLVVGDGMRLVALGIACGLVGAFVLMRALRSALHGVSPADPLAFGLAAGLLLIAALAASSLPARRAAACDPVEALRHE